MKMMKYYDHLVCKCKFYCLRKREAEVLIVAMGSYAIDISVITGLSFHLIISFGFILDLVKDSINLDFPKMLWINRLDLFLSLNCLIFDLFSC